MPPKLSTHASVWAGTLANLELDILKSGRPRHRQGTPSLRGRQSAMRNLDGEVWDRRVVHGGRVAHGWPSAYAFNLASSCDPLEAEDQTSNGICGQKKRHWTRL